MVWTAFGFSALIVLSPLLRRLGAAAFFRRIGGILKDPIFYLGAAFLALLWLQWWNAGRIQVYDLEQKCWTYSSPRHPGLPWAFTKEEAAEMLCWFFPLWVLLVGLRRGVREGRTARFVLRAAIVNASLLAAFGIAQFLSRTDSLLWLFPLERHFFAAFGYPNHAAAFFVLLFGTASAVLLREVLDKPVHEPRRLTVIIAGVGAVLAFCGANLSLSRAGIIMGWTIVLLASFVAARTMWPILSRRMRLNVGVVAIAIPVAGYFLVGALGTQAFNAELNGLGRTDARGESSRRWPQAEAALSISRDHPWFGVGGWGYRYLLRDHVEVDGDASKGEFVISTGMANVHNDPLQFLAEFGGVGFGLMTATVLVLLVPTFRKRQLLTGSRAALIGGLTLGAIFIHGLIDLPFRCPAVMQHWVLLLTLLPFLASPRVNPTLNTDENTELVNGYRLPGIDSTTANIAEGYGRFHFMDNAKFCSNSRGSCCEVLDHLITAHDEHLIPGELLTRGRHLVETATRLLNGYMGYLKRASKATNTR